MLQLKMELEYPKNSAKAEIELERMPDNWALQKPLAEYDPQFVDHLIQQNRIIAEKKYNGHRIHVVVNSRGEVLCHSRGNKSVLNSFMPETVRGIESLGLPPNTLMDGEIYVPSKSMESLEDLQKVIASGKPERGAQNERAVKPKIAFFDCLAYGGEDMVLQPYQKRFERCEIGSGSVHQAEVLKINSLNDGLAQIQERGIEGMVLWDSLAPHKLNTAGNTKRGRAYKLKRLVEEDFVAIGFNEGRGQGTGMVGTLTIGKPTPSGFQVVGEVGSGLSQQEKAKYMDSGLYPFVVEVKHFGYDEMGRVTMPRINKIHTDKVAAEMMMQKA